MMLMPMRGSEDRPPLVGPSALDSLIKLELSHQADVVTVFVTGEVDMCTTERLYDQVIQAIARHSTELVIDLTNVTFFSASGISALVEIRSLISVDDVTLKIKAKGNRPVMQVLVATGMTLTFTVV